MHMGVDGHMPLYGLIMIYICTQSVGTSLAGVSVNNDSVAECVVKL